MDCKTVEEAQALEGGNSDTAQSYGEEYNMTREMFIKFDDSVDNLVRKLLIILAEIFVTFDGQ